MLRTKHLILILLAIIIVGLLLLIFVYLRGGGAGLGMQREVLFIPGGEVTVASAVTGERNTDIRESLLRKLHENGQEEGAQTTEAEDVEEELETGISEARTGIEAGDGKGSAYPEVGRIFACTQQFLGEAPAAVPWIRDGVWYREEKVSVDGAATWPSEITIVLEEGVRTITSNGLPDHGTGAFPIFLYDDAYAYASDQNTITEQSMQLVLPLYPEIAASPSCLSAGIIGIGLNGSALFGGLDAEGYDAVAHEVHDACGGHPDEDGIYHYHNESDCLLNSAYEGAQSTLLGYALDGFGIFSSVESGTKLTNAELDVCHGHEHTISWDGALTDIYHYHMTDEYPYTLGCFRGAAVRVDDQVMASGTGEVTPPPPPQ